jgi:hypothetical protein
MKRRYKVLLGCIVGFLVVRASITTYNNIYNVTLEAKDVQLFAVQQVREQPTTLRMSGHPFYSGMVIRSITTRTQGSVMTVTVHLALVGLVKPNKSSGMLDYELTVPESVNEVRFGTSSTPIWRRN